MQELSFSIFSPSSTIDRLAPFCSNCIRFTTTQIINLPIVLKRIFLSILFLLFTSPVFMQVLRKSIPDKLVVLTFDDGVKTHSTFVAPLLKQYRFGATFFVCEFPPNFSDTSKYMSWKEIKQLDKMGFEVGSHTRTHKHVNKMTMDQFIIELKYIENKCD